MSIEEKIKTLREYLMVKVEERDWREVSNAANDLRILEAYLEASKSYESY